MTQHFTATDKRIAKAVGVTPLGLQVLSFAATRDDGEVHGQGTACVTLVAQGYAAESYAHKAGYRYLVRNITEAGREVVRRARAMGW